MRAALATGRAVAAWARWRVRGRWRDFGEPFNGQRHRIEAVERIAATYRPDAWVETGTLVGHTTRWLADRGGPVYTVEAHPGFCRLARWRLRRCPNVSVECADSPAFLRRLAQRVDLRRPFAYLDAHTPNHSPVAEEVHLALDAWDDLVVLIDDAEVPGDRGYGYDRAEGSPLSAGLLDLPADVTLAYPAVPSSSESGARRGSIWLARGADARAAFGELIRLGMLRPG